MRRILTFLIVAMAFVGAIAQVEITTGETVRGSKANVVPENMYLTCMVGETVTDTVYVYNLSSSNIDPLCAFNSSPGYIWCEGDFGVIPPGGVGKSVVTYSPETTGTHTASLSMNIGGEYYSVHFTGEATEPNGVTDPPEIEYTHDDQYYTVTAIGNGTVLLYCDGEPVDNPCQLARDEWGRTVLFSATAQEPGKYISETTYLEVLIEPTILPYILPTPTIYVTQNEDGDYIINVIGDGNLHLLIYGEEVQIPFVIHQTSYEQTFEVEAYATSTESNPWGSDSEHAYQTVVIPAYEMPVMPPPTFTTTMDDDYVTVYAEGEGWITLYIEGEQVNNPYQLPRAADTYYVAASAVAAMDGYLESWSAKVIEVPAVEVEPMEKATAPTIKGTGLSTDGYMVEITCAEPDAYIYYRLEVISAGEWIIGEWTPYDEAFVITEIGHYKVEAYASVPGKLDSDRSGLEFIIAGPTICYDFEEDGIYYSIIDDDKVSVSKETLGSKSYSGVVNIPNTVTHDGVTYMVTAISDGAFRDCVDLTAVTIGDYVTEIENNAFRSCYNLTSIELGDYVIYVGDAAFFGCIRLESVILGKGLNHLGRSAFASCSVLADVTCKAATPPTMVNVNAFENSVYQSATLHVYPPVADSYKSAEYWSSFTNVVGEDVVSPKKGDTNGDGLIDINDVTNMINHVLTGNW